MFLEPCFVRASCWATAAARKRRNSTWFARSCFSRACRCLPFRPTDRIDIVPVDYVAESVVTLHQKPDPAHEIYHLSSGTGSETFGQLTHALAESAGKMEPLFWPGLERNFSSVVNWLSNSRGAIGRSASLLKVFMPYLVWDTVFDNSRVVAEMGRAPEPFSKYCYPAAAIQPRQSFLLSLRAMARVRRAWSAKTPRRPAWDRREGLTHDGLHPGSVDQRATSNSPARFGSLARDVPGSPARN